MSLDAKTIEAAYKYHPGEGWKQVLTQNGWAFGPTFAVKKPEDYKPEEREPEGIVAKNQREFKRKTWMQLESLLRSAPLPQDVDLEWKTKHSKKCSARRITPHELGLEMGFPLVRLFRKAKVTEYALDPIGGVLFGYDDKMELLVIAKAKYTNDKCVDEEEE